MLSFLKPTISFLKKAFLVIAVYFIVISLFSYFINKDKASLISPISPIEQNRKEIYKVINDKELNKTKEGKLTIALYKMSMCSMIGEACTDNPADADKNYGKSVFGFMSNLIIIPYANPPASGVMWAYEGLQNAGFVPKTMAAEGIGFAAIKPFSNLWKIFRDLSYMLLVIILIAIGFMIMFRAKINPQTVISVENALPKIVIALILITFSFAIAGFLIDLMYMSIVLLVALLGSNGNNYNVTQFQNNYIGAGTTQLFKDVSAGQPWFTQLGILPVLSDSILGILPPIISIGIKSIVGLVFTVWIGNLVHISLVKPFTTAFTGVGLATVNLGNIWEAITGTGGALLAYFLLFLLGFTAIFTIILNILLVGTLLFLVFRIFALLFVSYLKLLLLVIIGPFLLIFEAIPGKNVFAWWLKSILGNLLAFPVTIAIFLIGYIIINSSVDQGYANLRLPYLNEIDPRSFKILIGLGLIILIPDLVKVIKEALGIKDLPISIGIGTFFGGAAAVGGAAMGGVGQFGSISLALGAFSTGGAFGKTKIGQQVQKLLGQFGTEPGPPIDPKAKG